MDLGALLEAALTNPAALQEASAAPVLSTLRDGADRARWEAALETLAGLLYARPDLVPAELLDVIAELTRREAMPDGFVAKFIRLWQFLAAGPFAPRAWALLSALLRDDRVGAGTRARLVPLVHDFAQWREDVVGLDDVFHLAESPLLETHRAFLLDYGVERFVFREPHAFTPARLERMAALFAAAPRYRYVLYALAARPGLAPEIRTVVARSLTGQFPWHDRAAALLTGKPARMLVVFNVGMGQGDDVVRLVPLLQGLLDANPALTITLVTWRVYLYDSPRVTAIPLGDDVALERALREPFDGVLEFFQPEWLEFTFRIELHAAVERVLAGGRPALRLAADLGRAYGAYPGGRSAFLYQRVELDGQDIAASSGLDQMGLRNNYEPCQRLLAELGLPQRAGEERPSSPFLLTGTRSADAERVWADLAGGQRAEASRPVALVNPFGGSGRTKGFLDQGPLLAAEMDGLVSEGYRIVLLPNSTAWGGPAAIAEVLVHLPAEVRAHVAIAPDPAESAESARLGLTERSALSHADRVMRLFKYFTSYADLVVTVEGWMAHFAYNLGRPFRLLLAAGSFSLEWAPHGRSGAQRVVPALSPRACTAHSEWGLLRAGDPPPLPHRPRKILLELALAGLGRRGDAEALALLQRAITSPDPDVRTWAMVALGRSASATKSILLAALEDPWPVVVREAVEALLREQVDCSRELGPKWRQHLQAHLNVVQGNWDSVEQLGPAALPALFAAGKSEGYDTRHGARSLLRRILSPYVPSARAERRPPQSAGHATVEAGSRQAAGGPG